MDGGRPQTSGTRRRSRATSLAASLGLERKGLRPDGIQLDHTSSDELLALQETLLLAERLQYRMQLWEQFHDPEYTSSHHVEVVSEEPIVARGAPAAAALRELPPQEAEPFDPSRLRLLKQGQQSGKTLGGGFARRVKRFEPTPGAVCEAQYSNGCFYKARITATSRADDGSQLYVVRFEDDGHGASARGEAEAGGGRPEGPCVRVLELYRARVRYCRREDGFESEARKQIHREADCARSTTLNGRRPPGRAYRAKREAPIFSGAKGGGGRRTLIGSAAGWRAGPGVFSLLREGAQDCDQHPPDRAADGRARF